MTNTFLSSVLALSLLAGTTAASAGTKKMVLDGNEIGADGTNTTSAIGMVVKMSDAALAIASVPFALPSDYKKNSTIKVKVHLMTDDVGCHFAAGLVSVMRSRPGKVPSNKTSADAGSGVSDAAGFVFPAPSTVNKEFSRTIVIAKPTAGNITSQKPGDKMVVMFGRAGLLPEDSCTGDLMILGATVIYDTP